MPRLRLSFGRDDRLKYVAHLDVMRLWERAFRRADIPLSYSEGFNPHPKVAVAAPLAVGMTSVCEQMDVHLEMAVPTTAFLKRLSAQLPSGLWLVAAEEIGLELPSLAATLRFAEYEVDFDVDPSSGDPEKVVASLLAAETLPRERIRDGRAKRYDLRPLVSDLRVKANVASLSTPSKRAVTLWMRLQASPVASGRPEEVMAEMGLEQSIRSITRVGLIFENNFENK